jgi:hypothetical protein
MLSCDVKHLSSHHRVALVSLDFTPGKHPPLAYFVCEPFLPPLTAAEGRGEGGKRERSMGAFTLYGYLLRY